MACEIVAGRPYGPFRGLPIRNAIQFARRVSPAPLPVAAIPQKTRGGGVRAIAANGDKIAGSGRAGSGRTGCRRCLFGRDPVRGMTVLSLFFARVSWLPPLRRSDLPVLNALSDAASMPRAPKTTAAERTATKRGRKVLRRRPCCRRHAHARL